MPSISRTTCPIPHPAKRPDGAESGLNSEARSCFTNPTPRLRVGYYSLLQSLLLNPTRVILEVGLGDQRNGQQFHFILRNLAIHDVIADLHSITGHGVGVLSRAAFKNGAWRLEGNLCIRSTVNGRNEDA